ncbi:MAG: HAMP domain-containing histidine kinase [Bacteroidia bacterium]|nr:HAMP domain-containing histidine kinase [Bacteroidia bacterium]
MRLKVKFAIYNAISKALIIAAFGLLLPVIVERVVFSHIDNRLRANADRAMSMVKQGGLDDIKHEQDCSYADHTIFKEEFIKIEPITDASTFSTVDSIDIETWILDTEELKHRVLHRSFMYDNQMYALNIGEGLSTIEQLDKAFTRFTIWLMVVVVLISIASDFGFIGMLLLPFNKILNKLKAVDNPIKFKSNPVNSSTAEFTYLDQAFENLMLKIKDDFNHEKAFIANVSHELQTPISILQNRFENIITDQKTDHDTALKLIDSQKILSRLSRIIKALLTISKVENEQFDKSEVTNLNDLISEIIEELQDRCAHKEVTMINDMEHQIILAKSNTSLLQMLFNNLLINALKYNKHGGNVTITSKLINNDFEIAISDTGLGIEPEQIAIIFDRFTRLHQKDANSHGLGLSIVKTIANYHQLNIAVTSTIGVGTTFIISGKS